MVESIRANDDASWQQFIDLYGPLIIHWCRQAGLSHDEIADVFQEVAHAVAANIHRFDRRDQGGTFRGWLLVITQNKIRDYFRRQANRPVAHGGTDAYQTLMQLPDPDEDQSLDSTGHHPVSTLLNRTLDRIRDGFDDRTWQAFWRTAVDGQKSNDVADQLGMTAGAVRKAKARILRRLRRELGEN